MADGFMNLLNGGYKVGCYIAVSECLNIMKQVLQRDLAMHILIKWYGVRNAPGTQDISPAQEWQLFIGVLLGKI
jgi:anaphase-promoting complex subunit 1